MSMLAYSTENPQLGTSTEEWQPHAVQSRKSKEWWYFTSLAFDNSGNPYFLLWCLFHFSGADTYEAAASVPDGHRFTLGFLGLTDYASDLHITATPFGVSPEEKTWDGAVNAVAYDFADCSGTWSFTGDDMHLTVNSAQVAFDLRLSGAGQVMYAKDKLGIEGFIQEGDPEDRSYYYSLPRMTVNGHLSFADKDGSRRSVEVFGPGWVDRQWGDYLTKSWEWSSLRFANGARVNLYNFANGHQVATYQRGDGSTTWLDGFVVRQNGYLKAPASGTWVSWGWSYEFPVEVEGSRHYTLRPFSQNDIYDPPGNTLFEGPSHLVNDETREIVGTAVSESMDINVMRNGPGQPNQH